MELEEIRSLTIKAVGIFNGYTDNSNNGREWKILHNIEEKVEELMNSRTSDEISQPNATPTKRLNDHEKKYIIESFQDLINQGILMWGREPRDFLNDFPTTFSVTSYGKRVFDSGEITPYDPHNYLKEIKNNIPNLASLPSMYIKESLLCHLKDNQIASAVMLGVASEAVFYQIFDSFKNSNKIGARQKGKCKDLEKRLNIKDKFDVVYDELRQRKKEFDQKLAVNYEVNLNGIFNLIRLQRNESGHPTGLQVNKDQMFANLIIFKMYCKTAYDLINWLEN